MKKIIALMLSLMLLLPALAMAEAAPEADVYTVDLGDFTIDLSSADIVQQGQKAENAVCLMIYPGYDETVAFHSNITAAWTAQDLSPLAAMSEEEITSYGNAVLGGSVSGLEAQNIAVTNGLLAGYEVIEPISGLKLLISLDADYTGAGVDLKTSLGMIQVYYPMGDKGTYVFSFTATDLETAAELVAYLDTIVIK